MVDIVGTNLLIGDTVVAIYENRLYGGVIVLTYPQTGAVDVKIIDPSLSGPRLIHCLFPNTQLFYTESRKLDERMKNAEGS